VKLEWLWDVEFLDSPGLMDFDDERPFIQYIVDHSDIILFVIDDSLWIWAREHRIMEHIIKTWKKNRVILVANKLDINRKQDDYLLAVADYYSLWIEYVVWASGLLDVATGEIVKKMKEMIEKNEDLSSQTNEEDYINPRISFAIVGKPNAGKSTLLNTFVGKYISKVEDKAGTTRDYINSDFEYEGIKYTIFDTAGIKRKWHMKWIEKIAYTKTKAMLEYIRPIVLFLFDAEEGLTHRDLTLMREVYNLGLPFILCINKMDILDKKQKNYIMKQTKAKLDFAPYIPIVPMVAKTGVGISDVMMMIWSIYEEANKRIDTADLNKALNQDRLTRPPRFPKNKICKIMYATQIDVNAPTFIVFVNHLSRTNFAFKRWIENTIRAHFGFVGTPLVIRFKEKSKRDAESYFKMSNKKRADEMIDQKTWKKLSKKHRKINKEQKNRQKER